MMRVHFTMGSPTVSLVLVVVLGICTTQPVHTTVHAEGSRAQDGDTTTTTTTTNMVRDGQDNQCVDKTAPLQRRQDLLDNRMNERDTSVNTRLNEHSTRLNRIDAGLDGIETAISDMKDYLQKRMAAMDKKVEWALTGTTPQQDGCPGEKQVSYLLPLDQRDFRPRKPPKVHKDCQEALRNGWTTSGIYHITPDPNTSLDVFCEQQLDGGGWMVFQARKDGSVNFYRDWHDYKQGFGELISEFWLGNTNLHLLTQHHDQELKVELISAEGEVKYADYSHFSIDDEIQKFRLSVSGYSRGSPPGDSLGYHHGKYFSTHDQDNDLYGTSCATSFVGAWWYGNCHHSNLNGLFGSAGYGKGLNWKTWKGVRESMKSTRMMIRKRQ